MTDSFIDSEISVQTLAVQKVLEGLIHNINTPLNLILGYSQQMKKMHPELVNIEKIYIAGLQIDDLIQACARQISSRLQAETSQFDLTYWIINEVKLLNNIIEIKRNITFETVLPMEGLLVQSSQMLLSLFMESTVLYIKNATEATTESCKIRIALEHQADKATITVSLPEDVKDKLDLETYLTKLQIELDSLSSSNFAEGNHFSWQVKAETEIQIFLQVAGQ